MRRNLTKARHKNLIMIQPHNLMTNWPDNLMRAQRGAHGSTTREAGPVARGPASPSKPGTRGDSLHGSQPHRPRAARREWLPQGGHEGWYIPSRPDEPAGDSTAWYASFWAFLRRPTSPTASARNGACRPSSLCRCTAETAPFPRSSSCARRPAGNKPTPLPHDTSLFDMRASLPPPSERVTLDGLRLFSVPAALIAASEPFLRRAATDVRAAMAAIQDASDVLRLLLEGGHSTIAGRIAGAFRQAGQAQIADEIVETMKKAGYAVRETDPFADGPPAVLRSTRAVALCQSCAADVAGDARAGSCVVPSCARAAWRPARLSQGRRRDLRH